jgi:hypothetical protein
MERFNGESHDHDLPERLESAPPATNGQSRFVATLSRASHAISRKFLFAGSYFGRLSGLLGFAPREDDIFIASYPRSGTTWLQMILYQVTTSGGWNFKHITEVVPYFERSVVGGRDVSQLPSPRVFKTHLTYKKIPGFGKHIYVVRDPRDVLVSNFHFQQTHGGFKGTFPEFFDRFVSGKLPWGLWSDHVSHWTANAAHLNLLVIRYEDLKSDLPGNIQKIAEFCGVEVSPSKLATIAELCSFESMKKNEEKFDFINEVFLERGFVLNSFIREGKTGSWRDYLNPEQESTLQQAMSSGGVGRRGKARGVQLTDRPSISASQPASEGAKPNSVWSDLRPPKSEISERQID